MDLNQFLLALKARRKAFYTVLAATVFTALAIALIVPKNYVASTTILIDARDEQQLSASERLANRAEPKKTTVSWILSCRKRLSGSEYSARMRSARPSALLRNS